MGSAVIGALRVDLSLGTSGWQSGISKAQKDALGLSARLKSIGSGVSAVGKGLSIGITAPFAALIAKSMPAAKEAREALGVVEAALKSTGGAAGRTSQQLQDAARDLMKMSTFDDDEILKEGTANLLKFGSVAGDVFDRAQRVAVDMAAKNGNLAGSFEVVGKALNTPEKAAARLLRAGIKLEASQIAQIKAMVAHKDVAGAQGIILDALSKKFDGQAAAMRAAQPDQATKNSWDDFQETVGELALQVLPKLTNVLGGLLEKFNAMPPGMQTAAVAAVAIGAALGPIMMGLGPLISLLGASIPVLYGWGASAIAGAAGMTALEIALSPVVLAIAAVALAVGAVYLAWKNWDTIGPMLSSLGQAVMDAIGPSVINLFNALKEAALALWNSAFGQNLRTVVSAIITFHKIMLQAFGAAIPGILRAIGAVFKSVFDMIAATIRFVVAILSGDWAGAWAAAKDFVRAFAEGVGGLLGNLAQAAIAFMASLVNGIKGWIGDKLEAIWNRVAGGIEKVKNFFRGLWDAVVGHSYIPDMVDGIALHMARLDGEMVAPVKAATEGASAAMKKMAEESYAAAKKHHESLKAVRDDIKALLERLFPEAAAWQQYQAEMKLLVDHHKAVGMSADEAAEAIKRLREEGLEERQGFSEGFKNVEAPWAHWREPDNRAKDPMDEYEEWADRLTNEKLPDLSKSSRQHTAEVVKNFAEMAQGVVGALRNMVDAFKNGDFFDKVLGVLDLVKVGVEAYMQFKGGGASGSGGMASLFGGSRALGGPVIPGRQYRVGERGPEWFTPNARGRVDPGEAGPRGGNRYYIEGNLLTPEFWEKIEAMDVATGARASAAGADLALGVLRKKSKRSLRGG